MDRNGDQWTGDDVEEEARGEGAAPGGRGAQSDEKQDVGQAAARHRSIETAAEGSVRLNDDGDASATTASSGATDEGE